MCGAGRSCSRPPERERERKKKVCFSSLERFRYLFFRHVLVCKLVDVHEGYLFMKSTLEYFYMKSTLEEYMNSTWRVHEEYLYMKSTLASGR